MTNINDTMLITSTALNHVSKELINQREFDNTTIVEVGNPAVLGGVGSSFSLTSYFKKEELKFLGSTSITLDITSTYIDASEEQVLCALNSINDNTLILKTTKDKLSVLFNEEDVLNLGWSIKNNDQITLKVQISRVGIDVLAFVGTEVYQTMSEIDLVDKVVTTCVLYIGSDPVTKLGYWEGSINLKNVIISLDNKEYFSTGILRGYTFNKIMVSDGTVILKDDSEQVLNHVAEFYLSEITRTENHMLLKATIGSNLSMSIQDVGLYCINEYGKEMLFSVISNVGISKSSDLGYSLILHVNLELDVVNTSILPEITVKEDEDVKVVDFDIIKRAHAYITSNLERMIKENSLGLGNYKDSLDIINDESKKVETRINPLGLESVEPTVMTDRKPSGVGYNKAQVNYRRQRRYNEIMEAYNASLDYSRVQEKFKPKYKTSFSDRLLEKVGRVVVDENGEASIFSEVDYVKSVTSIKDTSSFDLSIKFKVESTTSIDGTICCFKNECAVQPLVLSIVQGRLHLSIGQAEELVVTPVGASPVTYTRDTTTENYNGTIYYRWNYNGLVSTVPNVLFTKTMNPKSTDKLYKSDFTEYTGIVTAFSSGTILDEDIVKATPGIEQYIRVIFTGDRYEIYVRRDNGLLALYDTKYSSTQMGPCSEILFGINYSNKVYKSQFYGIIYLADFNFSGDLEKVSFLQDTVINSVVLKDYYHIPLEHKSSYDVHNLNYYASEFYGLDMQENAIEGKRDHISFDNEGFSLSIRAKLVNKLSKIVLAKVNPSLFKFEVKSPEPGVGIIVFTLYGKDQNNVELSKSLSVPNFRRYVGHWALYSVTYEKLNKESAVYNLYMNRELLASVTAVPLEFDNTGGALTNYIDSKSEVEQNYVSDILSFSGTLKDDNLFYLCNILDTNF